MGTCRAEIEPDMKMTTTTAREEEMVVVVGGLKRKWGTWEELVLAGAVLRHGTHSWDAVASELRTRTLYPFCFAPQVCKDKYEELQKRFCGPTVSWYEELRKHRVAELKRELERSEDSIGSLQSKLESLKGGEKKEKPPHIGVKYGSPQIESPTSVANTMGVDFSGKETSKDGLSAGSFTEETPSSPSPGCQNLATRETKTTSNNDNKRASMNLDNFGYTSGALKKRRGKRKRKECNSNVMVKDVGSSADKEESTGDCGRAVEVVDRKDDQKVADELVDQKVADESVDLMKILTPFMENKNAAVFRRRLDSQKKARYKKTIRRHMDLETIRFRVSNHSITSTRELHLDLLLLCNNALVYFAKDSSEYKSAVSLRNLVMKTFRDNQQISSGSESEKPLAKPPVKPRSARPGGQRNAKVSVKTEVIPVGENDKACNAISQSKVVAKKGQGRPVKDGRVSGQEKLESPVKGRKRARRR